jgi:hypothetical protein
MTGIADDESIFPALRAGAVGYLTKDASAEGCLQLPASAGACRPARASAGQCLPLPASAGQCGPAGVPVRPAPAGRPGSTAAVPPSFR